MALLRTQIGRKIQDISGNVVTGATATIMSLPAMSTATIYATESGTTTIAQPLITGVDGGITGWLEIGDYSVTVQSSSGTSTARYYASHPRQAYLETSGANDVPMTVKAGSALAVNMAEWKNAAGTTVMSVSTAGSITSPTVTAIQGSVAAVNSSLGSVSGLVTNTQGSVVALSSSLGSVSGTVAAQGTSITSISGSVIALAGTAGTAVNLTATQGSVQAVSSTLSGFGVTLGLVQGTVTNIVTQPFGTVSSSYVVQESDAYRLLKTTSSTAITITLPPNGSVAFPIGQGFDVVQMAAGTVTFGTAAAGTAGTVTILSTPSLILRTQNSAARVIKTNTNEWLVMGDMF